MDRVPGTVIYCTSDEFYFVMLRLFSFSRSQKDIEEAYEEKAEIDTDIAIFSKQPSQNQETTKSGQNQNGLSKILD